MRAAPLEGQVPVMGAKRAYVLREISSQPLVWLEGASPERGKSNLGRNTRVHQLHNNLTVLTFPLRRHTIHTHRPEHLPHFTSYTDISYPLGG